MKALYLVFFLAISASATEEQQPTLSKDLRESSKIIASTLLSGAAFDFLNNTYGYLSFFLHDHDRVDNKKPFVCKTNALTKIALPASILIACACRLGSWPKLPAHALVKTSGLINCSILASSIGAGIFGYRKYFTDPKTEVEKILEAQTEADLDIESFINKPNMHAEKPQVQQAAPSIMGELYMRNMCYLSGSLGTLFLITSILCKRYSMHKELVKSRKIDAAKKPF